jgi:hypothetical protein
MIVCGFSKKILWVGSCFAFMYLMPQFLEIMSEQSKILMKIQMQMMNEGGAGGD